jgi:5-methylcytosine-specific restriction endonuclease McrA
MKTRTWCSTHYERWRVHGDPMHETWTHTCTVQGCDKKHASFGYCQMHYTRWKRYGDVGDTEALRVLRYSPDSTCTVVECPDRPLKRGMCGMHHMRWKKFGDTAVCLNRWAERATHCDMCGDPMPAALGRRRYCGGNCQTAAGRAKQGKANIRCCDCGTDLPFIKGGKRGNGHGRCLDCAENAPCSGCGQPRSRSAGKLVCRPCKRPRAAADELLRRARAANAVCEHGPGCVNRDVVAEIRHANCFYCGQTAEHADHFVPLARGGKHCVDNLVPACAPCNLSKNDADPWLWWEAQTG